MLAWAFDYLVMENAVFFPLWSHLAAAAVVFILTALLFALGAFGGGDSKAATAFALWTGLQGLPVFLICVTILGAILGIASLCLRKKRLFSSLPAESWPARAYAGESVVPYGIAIFAGAVSAFVHLNYFGFAALLQSLS
jgi:prepilin peptidase CpaA